MKTTAPKREAPALQNTLINDYAEIFQKTVQTINFKHKINHHIITSGPPVKSNLRRLSPEKLTFLKEEIAQLLKDGIITPSYMPVLFTLSQNLNQGSFEWLEITGH